MITIEHRPKRFQEVAGQELVKRVLMSVVKNPEKSPKSIILQGFFGTGKTTMSRILARALNCLDMKDGEPCGKCKNCEFDIDSSPYYFEYDSAVIGKVEKIRELRDTFYYTSAYKKIVVFDESHLLSKQAQSSLLKVIEEAPKDTYFVFATTHIDDVLPTIRSRSLELKLELVKIDDIVKNLKTVCTKINKDVPEDILKIIASKSKGHMRDAHMLLDKLFLIGEEDFKVSVRDSSSAILQFLYFSQIRNRDKVVESLKELGNFPLAEIKMDFERVMSDLMESLILEKEVSNIDKLAKGLGQNLIKVFKIIMQDWFRNSFSSDLEFQSAMMSLYELVFKVQQGVVQTPTGDRNRR